MTLIFHDPRTETKELLFIAEPDFAVKGTTMEEINTKSQESCSISGDSILDGFNQAKKKTV